MKYKAVVFDFGGVLAGTPGSLYNQMICDLLGITLEQYKDTYFKHYKKINRDELTWPEFWKVFCHEVGRDEKYPELLELSNSQGKKLKEVNPGMIRLVDDLRDKGLKTAILSNNSAENAQYMRDKVGTHFDVIRVSAETGFVKPEVEAFEDVAKALGIKVEEMIFIDDSDNSMKTAQECGFKDILFENQQKLEETLKQIKVI